MNKISFVFFCFLLFLSCEHPISKSIHPLSLVPTGTEILIKINSSEGLNNGLQNNALVKALENYSQIKDLKSLLEPLYYLNKNKSLLALSKDSSNRLEISFIIPLLKDSTSLDSINDLVIGSGRNTDGITKLKFNNQTFYSIIRDSILFASNKLFITENSKKGSTVNSEIEIFYNALSTDKMVSIFIDHNTASFNPILFDNAYLKANKFSNYTFIEGDISQHSILLNGITKANDSTKSLINVFKNTLPQENKIAAVLPANIESFRSLTFSDYNVIRTNLIKHQLLDSLTDQSHIFENIAEIAYVKQNQNDAVILRSIDPSSTLDNLKIIISSDTYRDVEIYSLNDATTFINDFKPFINIASADHYINLDDFFIFSSNITFLKSFISNYQNDNVLSKQDSFKNLKLNLSDESSLLIYGDPKELNTLLNLNFNEDKKLNISNYKSCAVQYVYDTDFAHIAAVFETHKDKIQNKGVTEEFNISLETALFNTPQLVKNHTNNQMDIIIQDVKHNLYLISNQGKVHWKKQLEGKIIGDINQIDTYKNGRLQLVFNTSKRLYVLDRNGKNVNRFPLVFKDDITQPISVFDYDNKKKYRLMVTQNKSVLMYDKNGAIVKGFTYKNAKSTIRTQPKHFRIGRKDYIVFTHGKTFEVLDRLGQPRTTINERINFSRNEVYLYKNSFTTSNTNGELIQVNTKGNVNHKNLNLNSNHKITTTSKTFVSLNDNKLTIRSKTIELDFGDYTAPKIFYINDKIYVTVTDLQSKKGFLFDSQAIPIANFPVYANSSLELNNIDGDEKLEVLTKGDDNAIIVYELQ
jgi:hypothetical protein